MGIGPGEWWWRKMMGIQMEKWTRDASCKNRGEKRGLCLSVLPRYCYVTLDKSLHALILAFLIRKIGRYEPSHYISWRILTEEVSAAEWKVHGLWSWPSWSLSGFGEALDSLRFYFKWMGQHRLHWEGDIWAKSCRRQWSEPYRNLGGK